MSPTAVRCSHVHGSASRRRCSSVAARVSKKMVPAMTPAEKNAHAVFHHVDVVKAA
jgi:hypothetical protein